MASATRNDIRFLLGGKVRKLKNVAPDMTVLDFLRLQEQRRGTKEGCGEGDCGACTIVIGEVISERMQYRAVNACIQFMGTLDGKQLLTVEDLPDPKGKLHPSQQAMIDAHGSQCGFCTPGFVMALFALYHEHGDLDRNRIDDALAGNLCRCTGYGPIVTAAKQMSQIAPKDHFDQREKKTIAALRRLQDGKMLAHGTKKERFLAPKTIDQLAQALSENPNATILAGGTDVGLWVTKQLRRLPTIIYVGEVAELKRIDVGEQWIEIGAGVTYTDAMPVLAQHFPDLIEMMRRLGSTQIRNAGTIGGNIANGSPIGDSPPALIALGTRLVLRLGEREREIPLEHFFLEYGKQDRAPGEFVARVRIPLPDKRAQFHCYKISKRFDQDITSCLGAFHIQLEDDHVREIRIAYGGLAGTPKRATATEDALSGKRWDHATVEAAIAKLALDFQPITDMRAGAEYRLEVAGNLLRKFLIETTSPRDATRIITHRRMVHAGA